MARHYQEIRNQNVEGNSGFFSAAGSDRNLEKWGDVYNALKVLTSMLLALEQKST